MKRVEPGNVFAGIFIAVIYGILGWSILSIPYGIYKDHKVTCANEPILYEQVKKDDSYLESGKTQVVQQGVTGEKRVCKRGSGKVTGEVVLTPVVNEVTAVGTKETPAILPTRSFTASDYEDYEDEPVGGGAICNDGSRSYSTGRGTCSWHGGVAYWL